MVLNFEQFVNEGSLNESGLQNAYKKYTKKVLATYSKTAKSPFQLDKADKKKYFAEVKKGWVNGVGEKGKTKEKEEKVEESTEDTTEDSVNESALQDEYKAFFKEILAKYKVNSPMKLSKEDKSKFFGEVKSGWVKGVGRKDKKKANEMLDIEENDTTHNEGINFIDFEKFNENKVSTEEVELKLIEKWLKNTTPDYDDYEWDGKELTVFTTDGETEKYSKVDLKKEIKELK